MNPGMWKSYWVQFEGDFVENAFRLTRMLGMGGFGAVFEADHIVEGRILRRVAVKLIPAEPPSMQRQLDELVSATMFQHPGVVRSFHAGSALLRGSKVLYLAMEIAAESLQSRLRRGVLSISEATAMTTQIASALDYLHGQKLVHRDLKSANVLLVNGSWKLSDFGTVRRSVGDGTDHTRGVIGTLGYMPPESFDGTVSAAWDMWSLGVLVLESLTGSKPYAETSEGELIRALMHKPPTIPADLSEPFDDIVRRCLLSNYRDRWSAQQVLGAIARGINSRVALLMRQAERARASGLWQEALDNLTEAHRLDPSSVEIEQLIQLTERQQHSEEQRQLRVRATAMAAAGDLDAALNIWCEVLAVTPKDPVAVKAVSDIREQQRVARLKVLIKAAVDESDYGRAGQFIAELQQLTSPPEVPLPATPAPSSGPGPGCVTPLMVMTTDDTLQVFEHRDLASHVIALLGKGIEIQIGATTIFEGREWMEVALQTGTSGYALGPSIRGHTTFCL